MVTTLHVVSNTVVNNKTTYQTAQFCCLCRDDGGCLYTVIQWKTSTSVLQSGNWANRTVATKVRNTQKTMIQNSFTRKRVRNVNEISHISSFSSNSSNSSSPSAVAHNAEEYGNDITTEQLHVCWWSTLHFSNYTRNGSLPAISGNQAQIGVLCPEQCLITLEKMKTRISWYLYDCIQKQDHFKSFKYDCITPHFLPRSSW